MLKITPIPAFTDNYFWLIDNGDKAVVVDPGDANPILSVLADKQLILEAIIVTHRHRDHIGGIDDLLLHFNVPVYGPKSKKIPHITHTLQEQDTLTLLTDKHLDTSLELSVMDIPGHTEEHIAYYGFTPLAQPVLFCGDTLFAAGCGRLLGGTYQQFYQSLDKINQLPPATRIYCAHEYTLANLNFAKTVEPDNTAITKRIKNEQSKRLKHQPTLPTTLELEQQTNPFLRYRKPHIIQSINRYWQSNCSSDEDLFTALRRWKDTF